MLDLYTEVPQRLTLKIALLVVFAIVLLIGVVQFACTDLTPEEVEERIQKSENLRNLDRFCSDLPKPYDFKLKFKTLGGNSFTSAISYWFWTDQPFFQIKEFYKQHLESDGWKMTELWEEEMSPLPKYIRFEKERFRISIERVGAKTAKYSLYCGKVSQ